MFLNILVAYDGSSHAERALAEAIDLAVRTNARLTVLTVVADPPPWLLGGYSVGVDWQALLEETEQEYRKKLDAAVEKVPASVSLVKIVKRGTPAREILAQIQGGQHDLVVMGSRGRGDLGSMVLGSVSHAVLHRSPAGVLVLPGAATADRG
jgi:nucleotide-binding universal stress UspA family protein